MLGHWGVASKAHEICFVQISSTSSYNHTEASHLSMKECVVLCNSIMMEEGLNHQAVALTNALTEH